ncbi:hypothetical protein ACFXA3_39555 [Streptomyces sp. NPDC059456]|uniref:hypothetical protein n=1 Tax=Streptomyces sp. NPDC059456 TaxID=3346838 RepID=UPI0036CFEC96
MLPGRPPGVRGDGLALGAQPVAQGGRGGREGREGRGALLGGVPGRGGRVGELRALGVGEPDDQLGHDP